MFSRNVTLALITIASTPVAFLMLIFIVKMASKYTKPPAKRGRETQRLYGREYFRPKKPWLCKEFKRIWWQDFLNKMSACARQPLKEECSQEFFSLSWMGMSLVNTAIVIFAGSAVLLNDKAIETSTALGLMLCLPNFLSSTTSLLSKLQRVWGKPSVGLYWSWTNSGNVWRRGRNPTWKGPNLH